MFVFFWGFLGLLNALVVTSQLLTYNTSGQVSYAIRISFADSKCTGPGVKEEQLRVGDSAICFQYAGVWASSRSFQLFRGVSSMNSSDTFVVTQNYRDSSCKSSTFHGRELLSANKCLPDLTNPGLSYRISWSNNPPTSFHSGIHGYVDTTFSASDCSDSAIIMRRTFDQRFCFSQPNSQKFIFSCRYLLTEKWDTFYTKVNKVQECNQQGEYYLSKFYTPPQKCQPADAYPGGGYSFNMFTPQTQAQTQTVMSFQGFYQSVSCTESQTDFFSEQISDLFNVWAIRTASSTMALLGSILTLSIIWSMKKWTDATRIIFYLSLAQVCYDASFYLPQPDGEGVATDMYYARAKIIMEYFTRVFSLCSLLLSNVLGFTVVYIVAFMRQFTIKKYTGKIIFTIFVFSIMLPLTTLLVELSLLPNSGPLVLADGKPNHQNPGVTALYFVGVVQVCAIAFNLIVWITVTVGRIRASRNNPSRQLTTDPLHEITRRLALYPLIQACTQLPSIWFIYDAFLKSVSDDTVTSIHYRIFEYVYALVAPMAGLLFCIVFVLYHPGARKLFKNMLKRALGVSSAERLAAELKSLQHLHGHGDGGAAGRRELCDKSERSSLGAFLGINKPTNQQSGAQGGENEIENFTDDDNSEELDFKYLERDPNGSVRVRAFTIQEIQEVDDEQLSELAAIQERLHHRHLNRAKTRLDVSINPLQTVDEIPPGRDLSIDSIPRGIPPSGSLPNTTSTLFNL